jgi:phosphoserine phosphatase RsbU/P
MLALQGNESRLKVSEFKLSTLLEITNAINNNLPEDQLFVLFQYILEHQLNIGKALVFLCQNGVWNHALSYGVSKGELSIDVEHDLRDITDITVMEMMGKHQSKSFDIVIPVFHQKEIIAHVLLGDLDEHELKASPIIRHLPFIQTLANLTAVAVENKRLMRESMKQEMLNHELHLASEMQGMLLPKTLPNDERLQVAATYRPHQEVGGDFYDVIRVSDDEVFFCMADVSGKGMSAAILMASFQASLRAHAQADRNLKDIVTDLNQRVWQNAQGERFITLFIARFNHSTRNFEYINSAHPPPFLLDKNGSYKLADGCVGLGMFEELPFINKGSVKLSSDALFVCYTDGLNELENEANEPFDEDQIIKMGMDGEFESMYDLNKLIMQALDNHRGPLDFQDDIALVSCRLL